MHGLALLLTSACAARHVPAKAPENGADTAVETAQGSASDSATKESTLDQRTATEEARRILAEVARARNLEVTRAVKVDVIDRPGIRAFSKETLYEETTPEELRLAGRIESSLGVLPVGADAERVLLDLLEQGVLGLYDPESKTLFIGDFVPRAMLSMVVGHEIAHGLQDMHFDLEKLQKPLRHRSDAESARRFLVEGEAQAAYLSWVSGDMGLAAIDDAVLDAMGNQNLDLAGEVSDYPILARSLQMPYADGTATIIRLVKMRGWEAVSALYRDLPATTEQMLHLDKLLAREPAMAVRIAPEPIAQQLQLEQVWHDTLGEAALLSMLAEVEPSVLARRSADGWGGDAYVAFDRKDRPLPAPVVVGIVAWDTKRDAEEFEASFRKYLDPDAATVRKGHEGVEGAVLRRKGTRVLFATHVPQGIDPEALAQSVWAASTIARPRKQEGGR